MFKGSSKLLLAFIFSLKFIYIICHKCIHDQLKIKPKINEAMQKNEFRFLQSTQWSPINFYIDYTYLNSQSSVDAKTIAFTKQVVENTLTIFTNILSIQRVNPKLILTSCADIQSSNINKDLKTTGINADIAIIPFFDIAAEATTEAYAAACAMDPTTKRPNGGIMAFNPKNFIIDRKNALQYYTLLVLHEINHILSFSSELFQYFVDSNYETIPSNQIFISNVSVNDVNRQMIISPKVLSTARKHFGCSNLQGVELEDQGGSGTAGNHWESRMMLGDFMIGESYPENVISEITLALFEDSGWYKVNYYTGGLFRYGKNKGCDFVQKKCINNQQSSFPNEFCIVGGASMCFASRTSKGFCDLDNKSNIPIAYRYFTDPSKGGFLYGDFCPVAKWDGDNENNMFFSSSCAYGIQNFANLGETIGSNSACFMSSMVPTTLSNFDSMKGQNRAICYSYNCDTSNQTYTVTILDKSITCNKEGGIKTVDGLDGNFYCPDYYSVCTKTNTCIDAIECATKKVVFNFPNLDYTISNTTNIPLNNTSSSINPPPSNSTSSSSSSGTSSGTTQQSNSSGSNAIVNTNSENLKPLNYVYLCILVLMIWSNNGILQ